MTNILRAYQNHAFPPVAWLSGLLDADPKLKKSIKANPQVLYSLVGKYSKEFGEFMSVWSITGFVSYCAGYIGIPYKKIRDLVK